jgi:hypothetical protein
MNFLQGLLIFCTNSYEILLFQNPFSVDIKEVPAEIQMEVTKLQSNDSLKDAFYEGNY